MENYTGSGVESYSDFDSIPDYELQGKDFIRRVSKNIYDYYTYFADNISRGRDDQYFALVQQWSTQELAELKKLRIPPLVFNKIYDTTKKIIGQIRQQRPNLQIRSKDMVTPDDEQENISQQREIDMMTNLTRAIAYDSRSNQVYQTAYADMIYQGYGACRVITEYDKGSFDQCIKIVEVPSVLQAFWDPIAKNPQKDDGNYCGVHIQMDLRTFHKKFPQYKAPRSFMAPQYAPYFQWVDDKMIALVDYYCKEWYKHKIYLLENGMSVEEEKLDEVMKSFQKFGMPIPDILDDREEDTYIIKHYLLDADDILEESEFPSCYLPVVFFDGNSCFVDGRQRTQSFIRHAIDAQRFVNYTGVAIAQAIKNGRRENYLVTPDNIRGYENIWRDAENQQGVLPATPDRKTGFMPQKQSPTEVPQTLYENFLRGSQDIQSILGVYDANLGAPTSEVSGIAQMRKIRQGNLATGVYNDNYFRGIEHVGRIVLEMIPRVYDTERTVSLLKQDGTSHNVRINKRRPDGSIENDLSKSSYNLIVEAGPSFEDQKEVMLEALQGLANLGGPAVFPLIADKIADNIDVENRPQLVERLRTLVPPAILAKEKGQPPPPQPPQPPDPQMLEMQLKQQELQLKAQDQQIKMHELGIKSQDQGLKAQDQQLESIHLMLDHQQAMSKAQQDQLSRIAEMHKAELDYDGDRLNAIAKMRQSHISSQRH